MNEFKIYKEQYNTEREEPTYNLEMGDAIYSGLSLDEAIAIVEDSRDSYWEKGYAHAYIKQEPKTIKLREYSVDICELFEDLLEENDITIPDDEREWEPDEARLYGNTYADLEYKVLNILNECMNDLLKHPDANIDIINL